MSLYKRYTIFIIAIILQATGISLVVKSMLGTSPISSVPYVLSLPFSFTFGQATFIVNMLFLLAQIFIQRKEFNFIQLMQAPMTIIFAFFIDLTMLLFSHLAPTFYIEKLLLLVLGTAIIALGVALQGIANVIMLPGEGLVYTISRHFKVEFGKVKTMFDCLLVILAAILSTYWLGSIEGIREGTLISAAITGLIARFFLAHLCRINAQGQLELNIFLLSHKKCVKTKKS